MKIGHVFGIEIFIDYSWLIIFFVITWLFSASFFPLSFPQFSQTTNIILGVSTSILFFISAFLHEIMHSVIAKVNKIEVRRITLFLFGGVSEIFEEPGAPGAEFKIAIAGPATSLVLGLIFFLLSRLSQPNLPEFYALTSTLYKTNLVLAFFNLLPGFPLDGGRILRSILWYFNKNFKNATKIASIIGRILAWVIIIFGVYELFSYGFWGGIWLVLIGFFLNQAASQSYMELLIQEALRPMLAKDIMKTGLIFVSPFLTIDDLLEEYVLKLNMQSLPVVSNHEIIGIINISDIRKHGLELKETTKVQDIMRAFPSKVFLLPNNSVILALKTMIVNNLSFIPIKDKKELVGIVTLEDIAKYLSEKGII